MPLVAGRREAICYGCDSNKPSRARAGRPAQRHAVTRPAAAARARFGLGAWLALAFSLLSVLLTILLGALSTVAGIIIMSALGRRKRALYREKFSDDQIGVFVTCRPDQTAAVEGLLRRAGCQEVTHAA